MLDNVSFIMNREDKIAFTGRNELAVTTLFKIISGEMEADSGTFKWGVTTSQAYFPKDNSEYFEGSDLNLVDWLRQYSPHDQSESFLRGFLGRMLFSGEEVHKKQMYFPGEKRSAVCCRKRCFLAPIF